MVAEGAWGRRQGPGIRHVRIVPRGAGRARPAHCRAVAGEAFQWIEQLDFLTADLDLARTQMVGYISTLTRE